MIARRPWLGIHSANDRIKSDTPHIEFASSWARSTERLDTR